MKGIVVERPGGPEVLQIRTVPTPELRPGWILIKVKAFGLNRSEIITRRGDSPDIKFDVYYHEGRKWNIASA